MTAQQMLLTRPNNTSPMRRVGAAPDVVSPRKLGSHIGFERVLNEQRARCILERKHDYVYDQSFDVPGAEATILAPMPGGAYWATAGGWLPASQRLHMATSCGGAPVLDAEQESHLFRRMNYLKYRAGMLIESLDPAHALEPELDEIERLQEEALAVKNQIIRANLRLVVSIAKKRSGPNRNFFELVSDGNLGLIRAVEKFDFARGFRFSTYASKAITRRFARSIPQELRRHQRFITGFETMLSAAADHRAEEPVFESDPRLNWKSVEGMLGRLNDRERQILVSRYGLEGANVLTLAELGTELGVTRQRVRQIESKAREKLRTLVLEESPQSTLGESGQCV